MHLYYCTIDTCSDLAGSHLLTPQRRAHMERYWKAQDKARCLAAGLLLRAVLGDYAGRLQNGPQGKPYLDGGPCFNLSHSGEYIILGVSEQELGVDVEQVGPWQERVARRCFTPEELCWLQQQKQEQAFYQLWTAKESIMKATGLGFRLSPGSFCVLPVAGGEHRINGQSWHLHWFSLPGYEVCTACAAPGEWSITRLDRQQLLDGQGLIP